MRFNHIQVSPGATPQNRPKEGKTEPRAWWRKKYFRVNVYLVGAGESFPE
jgi:hypothetical protein